MGGFRMVSGWSRNEGYGTMLGRGADDELEEWCGTILRQLDMLKLRNSRFREALHCIENSIEQLHIVCSNRTEGEVLVVAPRSRVL